MPHGKCAFPTSFLYLCLLTVVSLVLSQTINSSNSYCTSSFTDTNLPLGIFSVLKGSCPTLTYASRNRRIKVPKKDSDRIEKSLQPLSFLSHLCSKVVLVAEMLSLSFPSAQNILPLLHLRGTLAGPGCLHSLLLTCFISFQPFVYAEV